MANVRSSVNAVYGVVTALAIFAVVGLSSQELLSIGGPVTVRLVEEAADVLGVATIQGAPELAEVVIRRKQNKMPGGAAVRPDGEASDGGVRNGRSSCDPCASPVDSYLRML